MQNINEIKWFLNIRVTRNRKLHQMFFCQNNYVDKLISKFNINTFFTSSKTSLTNFIQMIKNKKTITLQQIHAYQQRIEFINFVVIIIRSDVFFAVLKLSEFFINSSTYHMKQVDKMLKYLIYTKNYVIVFNDQTNNSNTIFLNFSNVSFADDLNIHQNFNDYCFKFFNDMIDWKVIKQRIIIISFIEVELLVMLMTANIKMWWNRFFEIIQLKTEEITHIECDNKQTIQAFIQSRIQLIIKLYHVNIHRHWLRQEIQKKIINIQWIFTINILANDLTKTLSSQRHKKFVKLIDLQAIHLKEVKKLA